MDKKTETINTYNNTALEMAKKFRNIGARINDIEKGFSFVQNQNPYVLEIECGDGRDAKEILKKSSHYLGIDVSKSMIEIASKYVPEGKFQDADIESYLFPDKLDLIFAFASLLHSNKEAVKQILERAHGALNDEGIFYISLKHDNYQEKSKTDEFGTRTYYFYTPEDIKTLAMDLYEVVLEDTQELRGQKWFTIALRKRLP